jgi:hypothetical protein
MPFCKALSILFCFVILFNIGFIKNVEAFLGKKNNRTMVELSFKNLYPKPFLKTTTGKIALIGGSAIVVGTATFLTAGGALAGAGPIATWVGTQVGMTMGVGSGATAAGLATLGGGTIASGGLGMAGGVAVLNSISSLAITFALRTGFSAMPESYEKYRMITVTPPLKGDKTVLKIMKKIKGLKKDLTKEEISSFTYKKLVKTYYQESINKLSYIDPKTSTAGYDYTIKGVLEYNLMEYEKATSSFESAYSYFEDRTSFLFYMEALIALANGRYDDAESYLRDAIAEENDAIQPYLLLIEVLYDQGNPYAAFTLGEIGAKFVDDNYELNWKTAELGYEIKSYSKAIDFYKEALSKVYVNELEAHCKLMIAICYSKMGMQKDSEDWFKSAKKEVDDNPGALEILMASWNNK